MNILFIRRFLSGSLILVENILSRECLFLTPTTAQQRTATHENSNSAQIDLVPSDNAVLAGGVKIDYVQPVATDSKVDSYEVESSDNTLLGTAKVDGSAVSWVGAGEGNTLQFNKVNASEDGDYTLAFAYAQNEVADNNNFQTKSRWADVTVNGDSASTQHVVFTNTRSWKNYWTTSIRVTLKKGENTVLLGNANGYAPNFDSMAVARTAVQTSPEPLPEPSVDKSALQTLISKAKGVAEKDCTKESYAVLSAALQSAETVDVKADASQDEVDTAAAALQKALDGLKKAEGGNDGAGDNTKPGADNQGNTGGSDNGTNGASKDAIGNTGAVVGVIAIAAIVLAAAGALIMYRRRRA